MKLKHIVFVIALTFVSSTFAQEWTAYKNTELEFRADFLKTPKESVQKIPSAVGELNMHMISHSDDSNDAKNVIYSVIRSDYPEESFKNSTPELIKNVLDGAVEGAVEGAVSNVKGVKVFDNEITFNGFPGRNFKVKITGAYIYMNAYLVNNTMFITQVICLEQNDENPFIERFMNSFDLIRVKKD